MKSVTRYFRNAVAASMQGTVNYKKERFFVVTEGELLSGNGIPGWRKDGRQYRRDDFIFLFAVMRNPYRKVMYAG